MVKNPPANAGNIRDVGSIPGSGRSPGKAPYVFDGENAIALHAMQGIGPHQVARGKSHGFLEFRQAPRVYSRVTTWMPILNGSCLVKSGHLSRYDVHLGKLN